MKINVEIELDTIWADESNLSDELIYRIKTDVVKEIQNRVKDQIEDKITAVVTQLVKQGMSEKILQHYNEVTGQNVIAARKTITGIDGRSFTKENVTLDEYITSMFFERNGYNNLVDVLEKRAKEIITNLQKRYDILFASQIVNKMAEGKLLKDDAIANLLSDQLPKTQ